MTFLRITLIPILTAAVFATGCNAEQSGGAVKIVATSPDHSTVLTAGDVVSLVVEAEYRIDVESGTLSLVVQESDASSITTDTEVVTRGSGTTHFEVEFVVPDTKAVVVFTPLTEQGQSSTTTVDSVAFKVQPQSSDED